jgi:hypothetical protein
MEKQTFIEPELIKAGDNRVRLGFWQVAPIVDCRVITEDNYQLLKQAYDKMCALAENTPTSSEQLAAPAVVKSVCRNPSLQNPDDCKVEHCCYKCNFFY